MGPTSSPVGNYVGLTGCQWSIDGITRTKVYTYTGWPTRGNRHKGRTQDRSHAHATKRSYTFTWETLGVFFFFKGLDMPWTLVILGMTCWNIPKYCPQHTIIRADGRRIYLFNYSVLRFCCQADKVCSNRCDSKFSCTLESVFNANGESSVSSHNRYGCCCWLP